MSRFLLKIVANSLISTARSQSVSLIGCQQAYRTVSISSALQARQRNSSSGNRKTVGHGVMKSGFMDMNKDKDRSSKISGVMGLQSGRRPKPTSERQTRSSSSRQEAPPARKRSQSRDAGCKKYVKGGDSPNDHRAMGSVKHDRLSHRFILNLGDNQAARIDYRPISKNLIELYHTEVPEELRGRGIGKLLAKGALECASRDKLKLRVTCEYLEDYLKRFADGRHKKLVEK